MQIRIGFNTKLRLVNRPAGRLWLYDFGLAYLGTYSYLLSHIAGMKLVYDQQLDSMCQRMVNSGKKVKQDEILDYTLLADWKCYLYKFDLLIARLF